jgi:hypothetical protein
MGPAPGFVHFWYVLFFIFKMCRNALIYLAIVRSERPNSQRLYLSMTSVIPGRIEDTSARLEAKAKQREAAALQRERESRAQERQYFADLEEARRKVRAAQEQKPAEQPEQTEQQQTEQPEPVVSASEMDAVTFRIHNRKRHGLRFLTRNEHAQAHRLVTDLDHEHIISEKEQHRNGK